MAGEEVRQFSANAHREIQRDHTRLKAMVTNLARRQRVYDSLDSEPIKTITGVTSTSSSYPSYPSSGNTYVVKLNDYYFTEATGTQTRTSAGVSSRFVIARTWDGSSVAENTPVICDLIFCRGQGFRWWIRPAASAGASWPVVSCQLSLGPIYGGGSYVEYNKPGSFDIFDYYGDASEIGFSVNGSRSAYTDWCFSITNPGWYLWMLTWTPGGLLSTGTAIKTYTTSGPSSGAHHTHTVDIDRDYRIYGQLWFERQAGGSGSWDFGNPDDTTQGIYARQMGCVWHSPPDGYSGGRNNSMLECATWSERNVTANDRYRLTTWLWEDAWAKLDGVAFKASAEMGAQLTIVRIGDNPS